MLVPVRRLGLPISISSAKTYQGVNVLILWGAALKQRYSSPYWSSLRAWNQNECRVKKGERATHVVRWIEKIEVDPDTGEEEEKPFPIIHPVFNVAQVEGPAETMAKYGGNQPPLVMVPLSEPQPEPVLGPIRWEPAERLVAILNPRLRWGGNRACYSPRTDSIRMPDRDRFDTQAGLSQRQRSPGQSGGDGWPDLPPTKLRAELQAQVHEMTLTRDRDVPLLWRPIMPSQQQMAEECKRQFKELEPAIRQVALESKGTK